MQRLTHKTIKNLKDFLSALADMGELSVASYAVQMLGAQHLLMLVQSGLVCANPFSFVASPKLLGYLPVSDGEELARKAGLQRPGWSEAEAWGNLHLSAYWQPGSAAFANLGYGYVHTPIPNAIYEDTVPRPVWLKSLIRKDVDLADVSKIVQVIHHMGTCFLPDNHFVHSLIVVDPEHSDPAAALQLAVWGNAFPWIVLQLLILSDQETGSAYDWKIALECPTMLHRPLESPGSLPITLDGRYVCDLSGVVDEILESFRWVWVNRPREPAKRQYDLLSILRLLAGIAVLERRPGGRLGLTDSFRKQLFLNTSSHREQYLQSRNARERIREIIIRKSGESHA